MNPNNYKQYPSGLIQFPIPNFKRCRCLLPVFFPLKERPHLFIIRTNLDTFVDKLRRAVFEELKSYEYDVKRLDIHLFKVGLFSEWQHSLMHQKTDVPQQPEGDMVMRVLEWLHRQSDDKELRGVNLVATYFPDGPSILAKSWISSLPLRKV